jgi:flagellar hook-length control protein FliK
LDPDLFQQLPNAGFGIFAGASPEVVPLTAAEPALPMERSDVDSRPEDWASPSAEEVAYAASSGLWLSLLLPSVTLSQAPPISAVSPEDAGIHGQLRAVAPPLPFHPEAAVGTDAHRILASAGTKVSDEVVTLAPAPFLLPTATSLVGLPAIAKDPPTADVPAPMPFLQAPAGQPDRSIPTAKEPTATPRAPMVTVAELDPGVAAVNKVARELGSTGFQLQQAATELPAVPQNATATLEPPKLIAKEGDEPKDSAPVAARQVTAQPGLAQFEADPEAFDEGHSEDDPESLLAPKRAESDDAAPQKLESARTREASATEAVEAVPTRTRDLVIRQAADRIELLAATRPQNAVVVHLEPPDLGTMTITIARSGNEVEASMAVSHEQVRAAIESGRHQLGQTLEQRGLQLTQLTVTASEGTQFGSATNSQTQQNLQDQAGRQSSSALPSRPGSGGLAEAQGAARHVGADGLDLVV